MSELTELTPGAEVRGDDHLTGEVRRLVLDPDGTTVTHIVVQPRHAGGPRRLVPATLVRSTPDGLRMDCGPGAFEALPDADPTRYMPSVITPGRMLVDGSEVRRGDRVGTVDGRLGRIRGLVADLDANRPTHVLVDDGHLWWKRRIAVPVGDIASLEGGVRLDLTRDQARALPSVDTGPQT